MRPYGGWRGIGDVARGLEKATLYFRRGAEWTVLVGPAHLDRNARFWQGRGVSEREGRQWFKHVNLCKRNYRGL